jgi:hypothetical protein
MKRRLPLDDTTDVDMEMIDMLMLCFFESCCESCGTAATSGSKFQLDMDQQARDNLQFELDMARCAKRRRLEEPGQMEQLTQVPFGQDPMEQEDLQELQDEAKDQGWVDYTPPMHGDTFIWKCVVYEWDEWLQVWWSEHHTYWSPEFGWGMW